MKKTKYITWHRSINILAITKNSKFWVFLGSSPYSEGASCSDCMSYDVCKNKLCTNTTRDTGIVPVCILVTGHSPP